MEDDSRICTRGEKKKYMKKLGKVEMWFTTVSENLDDNKEMLDVTDEFVKSCSHLKNEFGVFTDGMTFEKKRTMIVITALNTFIRLYIIDKPNIIMSQKHLQPIIMLFVKYLVAICELLPGAGEKPIESISESSEELNAYKLTNDYAANILDSLLTNFAKDSFLIKCLNLFYPKQLISETGSDATHGQCSETDLSDPKEVLNTIVRCTSVIAMNTNIRSVDDFNKKYRFLISDLRIFVDNFFAGDNNHSKDSTYMDAVTCILGLVWNLTDKISLAPMLVGQGYDEAVLEWIEKLSFQECTRQIDAAVIAIVHNLSRNKDALLFLRSNNAFKILTECKLTKSKSLMESKSSLMESKSLVEWKSLLKSQGKIDDVDLIQGFGVSLIALATSDDELKDNTDFICKVSENLYYMCQNAEKVNNWRYDGYHISELLSALKNAFTNTSIIRHILDNESNSETEPIEFFAKLLTSVYGSLFNPEADDLEKIVGKCLLKILLCISNYAEYGRELKKQNQFYVLIESLAKRPNQDIAKRIYSNLTMHTNSMTSSHSLKDELQPRIYISYNRDDLYFCWSFVEKLRTFTQIPIWVDYENDGWPEDVWNHIAAAIKCATIFIVLVSNAYCRSIFNFQELNYAVTLAKSKLHNEKDSFIFVEIKSGTPNKREWIRKIFKGEKNISHKYVENQVADKNAANEILDEKEAADQVADEEDAANQIDDENTANNIAVKKAANQMARKVAQNELFLNRKSTLVTCSSGIGAQSRICIIM